MIFRQLLNFGFVFGWLNFVCLFNSNSYAFLINSPEEISLRLPINPSLYQSQEIFFELQETVLTPPQALADGFFRLSQNVNPKFDSQKLINDAEEIAQEKGLFDAQGNPLPYAFIQAAKKQGILSGFFKIEKVDHRLKAFSMPVLIYLGPLAPDAPDEGWVLVERVWDENIGQNPIGGWDLDPTFWREEDVISYIRLSDGTRVEKAYDQDYRPHWDGRLIALNGPIHSIAQRVAEPEVELRPGSLTFIYGPHHRLKDFELQKKMYQTAVDDAKGREIFIISEWVASYELLQDFLLYRIGKMSLIDLERNFNIEKQATAYAFSLTGKKENIFKGQDSFSAGLCEFAANLKIPITIEDTTFDLFLEAEEGIFLTMEAEWSFLLGDDPDFYLMLARDAFNQNVEAGNLRDSHLREQIRDLLSPKPNAHIIVQRGTLHFGMEEELAEDSYLVRIGVDTVSRPLPLSLAHYGFIVLEKNGVEISSEDMELALLRFAPGEIILKLLEIPDFNSCIEITWNIIRRLSKNDIIALLTHLRGISPDRIQVTELHYQAFMDWMINNGKITKDEQKEYFK